jgi:tRNA(Ile)-lysidine synthase
VVFNRNPEIEFMDYKAIRGGLRLRNWRAGDRFFPFGSKKAMKISDFLVNNKISVFDKEKIVLLCDEQKVLWICGMRLDDRAKITDDTVQVLKMTFSKSG